MGDPRFDLFEERQVHLNVVSEITEVINPSYLPASYPGSIKFTIDRSQVRFSFFILRNGLAGLNFAQK